MKLGIKSGLRRIKTEPLTKEEIDSEGVGSIDYPFVIRVEYEIPANWISNKPLVIPTPTY